jgi:MSHA biogenesis protein MshI
MFSFLKKKGISKGLSCVHFYDQGIAFIHALLNSSSSSSAIQILQCDFLPCSARENRTSVLSHYVAEHKLQESLCSCILNPYDYRLLLLESPNVPPTELKRATQFLIKDLVDYPIEQAAIEIFSLPIRKGQKDKVYVVATPLSCLQEIFQITKEAKLRLCDIDITELSLRNLLFLLNQQDKTQSNALLFIAREVLYLLVVYEDQIGLVRPVGKIGAFQQENKASAFSGLASEIQQSFTYYQSQTTDVLPAKLFVVPHVFFNQEFQQKLSQSLTLGVSSLDLNQLVPMTPAWNEMKARPYLTVIGKALMMHDVLHEMGKV